VAPHWSNNRRWYHSGFGCAWANVAQANNAATTASPLRIRFVKFISTPFRHAGSLVDSRVGGIVRSNAIME
jgi:hypothetical protein